MNKFLFLCLLPLGALGVLLGGYKPMKLDDPEIQSRIRPVLESHNLLGSLPIRKVEQQRLFGVTNYRVYQGIPTGTGVRTCTKITCHDGGVCDKPEPCKLSHFKEDSNRSDQPVKQAFKPHLLGGEEAARQQDVEEAVDFVVDKMNSMSNSMYRMVPQEISNITKQVVAGMMYRFTLSMISTQCRNNPINKGKRLDQCRLADNAQKQQCRVAVWHKLSGKYSLESNQCGKKKMATEAETTLEELFTSLGLEMPPMLRHLLFHVGTCRKDVYRALWGSLMFVDKLPTKGERTLVYPEEVREAVRQRFGDPPDAGAYDGQYTDKGYHVTMEELANATYRQPPKSCKKCA